MCGIVGILDFNAKDKSLLAQTAQRMLSALIHRGPDGWGTYISDHMALGHTRLSIIDLSGGSQPMMTDRYVISFNGEIYNHTELREELTAKGMVFSTKSDTEVILKAFEAYGTNAIAKFNGEFAFLLWDRKEKELTVVRDRYGIRPLYILKHNNRYYFASETKAFSLLDGYEKRFDVQNLLEHALLWNTLGDKTVYKNIRSLPSGTFEIYRRWGNPTSGRYYEIGESVGASPPDLNTAKEEFSALLNDSVRLRLRSDVPVGAYLSGGVDSSVITHLTAMIKKADFKTFAVAFEDKDFDESRFQREMAASINSDHLEIKVDYDLICKNFSETIYFTERPIFRTAPVPLFLLSKHVRESNIKVVLTGEAADEILFGYDSFKELKLLEFWSRQPNSRLRPQLLRKLYPHLKHYNDPHQFGLLRMFYEDFLDSFENDLVGLNIRVHNNKILSNFINKDLSIVFDKERVIEDVRKILPDNFKNWSLLQKNQFLEMKTLLSGYLLSSQGDRMAMSHSVEGRYPFLDHRLVEKAFYFQDNFKLNGFSQKHLLRESFRKFIPTAIIDRPKMPYQAPDLKSFHKDGVFSEQAMQFLSDDMIVNCGIFDPKYVSRFLGKFKKTTPQTIGYRDNMIFTFLLSSQIQHYWNKNPQRHQLNDLLRTVELVD